MKILVYTGYNNSPRYKEMGDFSSLNKLQYCQKHGYEFLCHRNYEGYKRPISWYKILSIMDLITEYDWVFWTDADSFIVNMDIKLEDIINSQGKEKTTLRIDEKNIETKLTSNKPSFICSDDELGPCMANFFTAGCDDIAQMLSDIYWKLPQFENHPWWDQGAAHYLWHTEPKWLDFIKILPKAKLHRAFHDYQPGDFIIHDKFHLKDGKVVPK